jgi:hypothetical protein
MLLMELVTSAAWTPAAAFPDAVDAPGKAA